MQSYYNYDEIRNHSTKNKQRSNIYIGYYDIEQEAIDLYEYNFPNIKNYGDITKIDETKFPDFDLFTGGFPCQPFSTVGKMLGELDTRGTLFNDIIRICEYKRPKYILLENVKGLLGKKHRPTFDKIISELNRIGYKNVQYAILNSKDYGVPQNRERLWIFGQFGGLPEGFVLEPPHVELKYRIKYFLDKKPSEDLYRTQAQIDRIHENSNAPIFDVYLRQLTENTGINAQYKPQITIEEINKMIASSKESSRKTQ